MQLIFKKWIGFLTLLTLGLSPAANADCNTCQMDSCSTQYDNVYCGQECCCDNGCAYSDGCRSSCLSPELAVGVVVIAATVAIILHNRSDNGHSHQ